MNFGPIQVTGLLFVAVPDEDSFIEARVDVLGVLQVEIMRGSVNPSRSKSRFQRDSFRSVSHSMSRPVHSSVRLSPRHLA
jgi:hypothetical protein